MDHSFVEYGVVTSENGSIKRMYSCTTCGHKVADNKPVFYKEMRKYLIDRFDAILCEWGEADDWLCTNTLPNTIIVSNDKDLLMAPGYHFRLSSGKLFRSFDGGDLYLSRDKGKILGVGFKWFCAQMLLGDQVDNIIKPKKGLGPKAVYQILKPIDSIKEMWDTVTSIYKKVGKEDQILINAKLLWMARKPYQMFSLDIVEELHNAQITKQSGAK